MSIPNHSLKDKAAWVYRETLRIHRNAPETRIASSLSAVEIFTALYYSGVLKHFPHDRFNEERDRCIISKGHGSICMYPILADLGYFDMSELERVCKAGSFLGGIPDPVIPGYETINGSLGHGLGVATGMAMGLKQKHNDNAIFVVTGDGELHEGSNWEAVMFAAQHKLDNLNVIVDNNSIAMLGFTNDIISHNGFITRFNAFGWECAEVDGHDVEAVQRWLSAMKAEKTGKPKILIAHTVKGRGVEGLENKALAHVMGVKAELLDSMLEIDP
jgi:transketolase